MRTLQQRFDQFVSPEPNTGCWLWTGAISNTGYGTLWDGRKQFAHRISHELFKGPIPAGLVIDHLCRQPLCVNPQHLEAVTPRMNIIRGATGKRGARQREQTACKRGHPFTPENTYAKRGKWRECRICSRAHKRAYLQRRGLLP